MKVGPAFSDPDMQRQGHPTRSSARSFGELLEAGDSARAIAGRRALGFQETGLFGLRFSIREDAPAPAPAPGRLAPEASPGHGGPPKALTAGSVLFQDAIGGVGPAAPDWRSGATTAPSSRAPEAAVLGGEEAAPAHDVSAFRGAPPKSGARYGALVDRLASRFAGAYPDRKAWDLRIGEMGDGIVVVVDGFPDDGGIASDLENLARSVGQECGITVLRLIVTRRFR